MKSVLFTQRVEIIESYNERRDCADQRISDFIEKCGYLPIPVPNKADIAEEMVYAINPIGIILTGGNSLEKYGGNAPERDMTDSILIEMAIKNKIPLYGFCRGMQSILNYYGNELVNVEGHVAKRHVISGLDRVREVNSYHNQACIKLISDELEMVTKANDGVVEEIRHKTLPIIGTMWHPERENPYDDSDINMIKRLFDWRGEKR